jgi:hypothetical protein
VPKDRRGAAAGSRDQRQIVLLGVLGAVAVWLIVLSAHSHGAIHTLGVALGLPVIVVLLLIALRLYRKSK